MRRYRPDLSAMTATEQRRAFIVRMLDERGAPHEEPIPAAYGRHDACNQARIDHPHCTIVEAVPA